MDPSGSRIRPMRSGWTYRFGIEFTVKAGEVQESTGAAFLEYFVRICSTWARFYEQESRYSVRTISNYDTVPAILFGAIESSISGK